MDVVINMLAVIGGWFVISIPVGFGLAKLAGKQKQP
jgi:hypothetical protein